MKKVSLNRFYKLPFFLFIAVSFFAFTSNGQATKNAGSNNLASPPLGWNSWDSYGMYPTEKAMLANLEVMAKRLKPFGYTYFTIDAGWNKIKDADNKIVGLSMDKYCRYIANKQTFPNGIKGIADKAHSLGLKFGIHIMRGIPREAYKQNLPISGTSYTARNIGDTTSTCTWNKDNYGVDMSKPGAQAYYDSYIGQLISWGVDFIKADDITAFPAEVQAVKNAIKKTGKRIVLSLSPGEGADVKNVAAYNEGDMLRVTKDIWDNQQSFTRAFDVWKKWADVKARTFWLDMDMIPFGHLCLHNPDPDYLTKDNKKEGEKNIRGKERMSAFTQDEKYTFITLRALSASPLIMGGDLPTSDEFSFQLLTNKDMLACNQNGVVGKLVYNKEGIEIWKTPNKNNNKQGWLGIFNRNKDGKLVQVTTNDLSAVNETLSLFDIWQKKDRGKLSSSSPIQVQVNGNGVVFCSYKTL